ncbi:D-tagatose-1,6-bisphosphate aldolase subunit KbaZ [Candidatus Sulfotelmatobacter kueseliae]|uniref:D-tagatose-1,6-bisphosphate aldolase subunit KbaZ n=1 Tax=Candidatus Sulfotelmatobacter kueseliae TaxID=2042962 RepID=A0A2U3KCA2_9BACT|nr:D-tagatose-1,6-bisphosphate aldolase subunit KbaZ [Candidatus Sulfotelmatobacter kueseliae]
MMAALNQSVASDAEHRTSDKKSDDAATRLQKVLRGNCQSGKGGTYAVCSAHSAVIQAAIQQSLADGSFMHVESTSSQVNQFGGYTGSTPSQFAQWIHSAAKNAGLPAERVLLGGDHLGPFPWRNEASVSALEKACKLVRHCVAAGYQKIHLDASMACADDAKTGIPERTIAARAAILCQAAEEAHRELPSGSPQPVYVVGTEVPAPGGESNDTGALAVTKAGDVHRTLEVFRYAFAELGLESAWERVIALVVQPGVDFGSNSIFAYDRVKAASLSAALSSHLGIVFEAHSTDYQSPEALNRMVEDHFAILKVGPWLTFAFRETVLALSAIEHELFGKTSVRRISHVREALEAAMLHDPSHWRSYYHGDEDEVRRDRIYGYSDRCRYYWNQPAVQEEIARLLDNVGAKPIPLTLISQYLPLEYEAIRAGELHAAPERMIQYHIRRVLRVYAHACSVKTL